MSISRRKLVVTAGSAAAVANMPLPALAATAAELVIFGGPVVTVNKAQPMAEAVAVKNGIIVAVGSEAEVKSKWIGPATRVIDLRGKTLMPGFIDAHGHFMNAPRIVTWANVSLQPVGPVSNIPDIVKALQANVAEQKIAKGEWVIGYGYDGTGLAEKREANRGDLDPYFPDNPVMIIHVSNHGAVLNSAAMKIFDITAATPTPAGGVIAREPGSQQPAGLLMETAFMPIFAKMPQPGEAELLELLKPAQIMYARKGVTTAQEGATHANELAFLRKAAAQNRLTIDLVSLPFIVDVPAIFESYVETDPNGKPIIIGDPSLEFGTYKNRLKLGGIKLVIDGSPQGKTAYWTQPLLTGGPAGEKDWVGEAVFPKPMIEDFYARLTAHNIQIWAHANGDAAIDMAIAGAKNAGVHAGDDRRYVVIHSQCMRPDQLEPYKQLGLSPSFFTEHTYFWGDVHLANLGQERAFFISPMKSAQAAGLTFSNHNDFMVTPVDPMLMIWSAVQRRSKDGVIIGPDERVDVMTAIEAITINAAWQYREEHSKGSIAVGKIADLVILDNNPLTAPVDDIPKITVVETFKDGASIYAAGQKAAMNEYVASPWRKPAPASRFFADDGTAKMIGCVCCDGSLTGLSRDTAVKSMHQFAASPLFA